MAVLGNEYPFWDSKTKGNPECPQSIEGLKQHLLYKLIVSDTYGLFSIEASTKNRGVIFILGILFYLLK